MIRARVTTISKNRYDFPIEFYTTFFIKAWHILFQELLTVYFSETMNQEISTLYWFLEKILIKDLAYKNNGQTFTSDIYMLIPNTNLSQMAAFIRSKK